MGEYYCPNCNADLEDQIGFDPSNGTWTCTECGQCLMDDDIAHGDTYEGVAWFCDECNALLNRQSGFSDSYGAWTCTNCGHINSISDDDIIEEIHKCPNCGANLKKQWGYSIWSNDFTCSDCNTDLHRDYSSDEWSVLDDKYKCPNCGANLKTQWGYSEYDNDFTCSDCNVDFHRDYSSDEWSVLDDKHKCPNCSANLIKQWGYSKYVTDFTCTECNTELHRDDWEDIFQPIDDAYSDDDDDDDVEEDEAEEEETTSFSYFGSSVSSISSGGVLTSSSSAYVKPTPAMIPLLTKGEIRKKRIKAFFFKKKLIPVGFSSDSLIEKSVEEIYSILFNCGFKHIRKEILKDVYLSSVYQHDQIEKVEINGVTRFDESSEFPYDADVAITVHKKKEISIAFSTTTYKRKDYEEAQAKIKALGFTNISISPIKDLLTGWLIKDGSVERIEIDGTDHFRKNSVYPYDVKIVIYYHTFKKAK